MITSLLPLVVRFAVNVVASVRVNRANAPCKAVPAAPALEPNMDTTDRLVSTLEIVAVAEVLVPLSVIVPR